MKYLFVVILALILVFSVVVLAAATDSHTVTVTVEEINEIDVDPNLTLTINTATAGSEPDDVVDSTTCDLLWTTNAAASKKITVASSLGTVTIKFTLKVLATAISGGTAATEVIFDSSYTADTAVDFVTGVSETIGVCDLQYTASATAAQGTGSDIHTVTYTITAG